MHLIPKQSSTTADVWGTCTNGSMHGCILFSELQVGGLCYACKNGSLSCRNALYGCPLHVRTNPDGSKSCETLCQAKRKPFAFEPPPCPICLTAPVELVARRCCSECLQGQVRCCAFAAVVSVVFWVMDITAPAVDRYLVADMCWANVPSSTQTYFPAFETELVVCVRSYLCWFG